MSTVCYFIFLAVFMIYSFRYNLIYSTYCLIINILFPLFECIFLFDQTRFFYSNYTSVINLYRLFYYKFICQTIFYPVISVFFCLNCM